MNHLHRELAPITPAGWAEIEKEAKRTLERMLAARKCVDFVGPLGWDKNAIGTGRMDAIAAIGGGVQARLRRVKPLVELRVEFVLPRSELDAIDRGAQDPDMDPVVAAARTIALAEDRAVFHGYPTAGIVGICETGANPAIKLSADFEDYPTSVAAALNQLRSRGIKGPFAIALGERCYTGLTMTTKQGYPVMEHVQRMIDGPLIWAPGVDGAVVLSMRGEDFEFNSGEDFAIGYLSHDDKNVRLYIEESFTFIVESPEAAVAMTYDTANRKK